MLPMPVSVDHAALTLLSQAGLATVSQVGAVVPVSLRLEGHQNARRLRLSIQCVVAVNERWWRLQAELVSVAWTPSGALPTPVAHVDLDSEMRSPDSPLFFTLACQQPPVVLEKRHAWLHYLPSQWATQGEDSDATVACLPTPVEQALVAALSQWLSTTLPLATPAQAEQTLKKGPVGHFGPVDSYLLERSGQADLDISATLLGSADNSEETGAEASYFVSLYGDRFGRWLLHRRNVKLLKPAHKEAPVRRHWQYQVLIAESAEQLITQAGLEPTEKRLFKTAGLLPPVRLYSTAAEPENGSVPPTAIDISAVPDRPRRHLHALAALAQQGKLDAKDIDLLLRTARHLAQ